MQTVAIAILVAASLWLVAVAVLMAAFPALCLELMSRMATTHRINLTEQGLRMTFGLALIVRAAESRLPWLFEVGGWFIAVTSVLIMILPLRWHRAYAVWWVRKLTPVTVRALSPVSFVMGGGLAYATI
jgi:hypothetical protein